MKLSTVDLRMFAAIADHGGISAAARKLGLTKSLVSRALAELEDRLGTRLVQRTTRRMSLTETGELLATYARRVVEEMDNAEAAIEAIRDHPRGDLKVSAPFSILRFVLVPRLARFRERYPDVRLSLDASLRVIDLIEEGIDVAIRIGELTPSSLIARRLATTSVVLVAAPGYLKGREIPAAPADLAAHDIINLRRDTGPDIWALENIHAERARVEVTPSIAVHDPGLILDLARQGLGIAPMPELYAAQALDSGELVRVLPEWTRGATPIHAVYPSRRSLAPKLRAFVEFVAEALR